MTDGLPQCMCSTCTDAIKFFTTFRSKCIESEASLQQIMVKQKVKFENNGVLAEQEVKVEMDLSNDYEDDYGYDFDNMEENVKIEDDQDLKSEITKRKRAPKKKTVTPNKNVKKTGSKSTNKKQNEARAKYKKIDGYSCGLCPKSFKTPSSFTEHVEKHNKDKLICEICKDQFENWEPFVAHRFRHLGPEQLLCHLCYRKFRLDVTFQNHFLIDHTKKATEFKCAWCDARVKSRRALNKHVVIHADRRYTCDYCQQTFFRKNILSVHIARHLLVKRYECKPCNKRFKYAVGLLLHKRKFHTEGEFCKVCHKVLPDRDSLKSHQCQNIVVCSFCGKMLPNMKSLKSHVRVHSTEDKYKCDICSYTSKYTGSFTAHKNMHLGIRPYQCSYCSMSFGTNGVLQKHVRIHTGEKPFVCEICHKGFTARHNLRVHMKVHGLYLVTSKKSMEEKSE